MRLRVALALVTVCLAMSGPTVRERLAPPRPPYDRISAAYQADLRRVFHEAFAPGVRLRALVTPSFQLEYAVGLRRIGTRQEIFLLRPTEQIWSYQALAMLRSRESHPMVVDGNDMAGEAHDGTQEEIRRLEAALPANPSDVPLSRCAIVVNDAVAAALESAWRDMLTDVRADDRVEGGADGTGYEFSMELAGRPLRGETWSPSGDSGPAKLARLAEAIRDRCDARRTG